MGKLMKSELIRLTVRCGNTGKLVDVDHEEVGFTGWDDGKSIAGVDMNFKCQLCGENHTIAVAY